MPQPAQPIVTQHDVVDGLRRVGVCDGEVLFAHSSLSSFGFVDGGADTVIDALLEAVGPAGTVALPTFTWGRNHTRERVDFDVAREPWETGRIPEVFRQREGVIRSVHVCHSVAAVGPQANELMGDGVTSFGTGSSLHRLYQLDSWYLFLGVTFACCTALHGVEEYMRVPYRYHRSFEGSTVILPDGTRVPSRSIEYLRLPGVRNDFAKMGAICAAEGILQTAQVGAATITNVRIRALFDVAVRLMEDDILFLLTPESQECFRERP